MCVVWVGAMSSYPDAANKYMNEVWLELRNDGSERELQWAYGAIAAFRGVGLFDADRAELWLERLKRCPGHDDECGRVWCSYCGTLRQEEE